MSTDPTKREASSPIVRFYVAEDFRQELHGKLSAVGLYTDGVIVINLPEGAPDPTKEKPLTLRSLAFAFSIGDLQDKARVKLEIESEGNVAVLADEQEVEYPGEGRSISIIIAVAPCQVARFGHRTMLCTVNNKVYKFPYEFRRGTIAKEEALVTSAKPKSKTKKVST